MGFSNSWQPCQPSNGGTLPQNVSEEASKGLERNNTTEVANEPAKLLKVAKNGFSNPEALPDNGKMNTCQVAKEDMTSKFDDKKDPWDDFLEGRE